MFLPETLTRIRGWGLERRPRPRYIAAVRAGSITLGVAIALLAAPGFSTVSASTLYGFLWRGTLGTTLGLGSVLTVACPLMVASHGAALAYQIGLWNLGIDGQMVMGGWCALAVGLLLPHLSGYVLVPMMFVAGMVGGALWILIPALARAFLGVSEIITTFLLTFVAMAWMSYWVTGPWLSPVSSGSVNQSKPIPAQTQLGLLTVGGVTVQWGIVIPIVSAIILWLVWHFTRSGYRLTIIGASERAAQYAGLSVRRTFITVLLVSGAFGGLAGVVEMLGDLHYLGDGITTNTGLEAVVVAVLAGGSFPGVVGVSLLYSILIVGGNAASIDGVAPEAVLAMLGITLLIAAIGEAVARVRVVRRTRPTVVREADTRAQEAVAA
jgi:ABC-type uncharacterized transport system permease subunit